MQHGYHSRAVLLALVVFYYSLRLVSKTRATFSTCGNQNQNRAFIERVAPRLDAGYMDLLRVLIGPLRCLRLFSVNNTLALFLRHSTETRFTLKGLRSTYVNSNDLSIF